jgi:protein-S-isoprenylcysteine O-methyltransferase Ste14
VVTKSNVLGARGRLRGGALGFGSLWPLPFLIAPFAIVNGISSIFKDTRLRQNVGEDYANYCRRLRRWV